MYEVKEYYKKVYTINKSPLFYIITDIIMINKTDLAVVDYFFENEPVIVDDECEWFPL